VYPPSASGAIEPWNWHRKGNVGIGEVVGGEYGWFGVTRGGVFVGKTVRGDIKRSTPFFYLEGLCVFSAEIVTRGEGERGK